MTTISSNNLGIAGEIALLVLNNEQVQGEADRNERSLARAMRHDAARDEFEALQDSADALEAGAWTAAAISFVGGGLTVIGGVMRVEACGKQALKEADVVVSSGEVIAGFARPANTIVGESTSQRFQAEARRAAFGGEQASWRADDASEHLTKVDRNQERVIDLVESINQSEQAAASAVVANV